MDSVILGLVPRIHTKHTLNVILGFIPRIHTKVDSRDTPENDYKQSLTKGLDVVCQYAALLERCVQSSTRVRKAQAVTRQTNPIGRSMIEMLGVLAIVGVLSIGGIAGYSKAMMKFKINKTMSQITEIATNVRTLYAQQKDFNGLNNETAVQMGIVPDELGKSATLKNIFGGNVYISSTDYDNDPGFSITYRDLSKDICIALATADWGTTNSSGVVGIVFNDLSYNDDLAGYAKKNCGTYVYSNATYVACSPNLPIAPAIAAEYCGKESTSHSELSVNAFSIRYTK